MKTPLALLTALALSFGSALAFNAFDVYLTQVDYTGSNFVTVNLPAGPNNIWGFDASNAPVTYTPIQVVTNGSGVLTTGTYINPSWLASFPFSKLTATPTTLGGYGISDAYTKTASDARYAQIATTLAGYGITDAYTKIASDARYAQLATTLAGYGITDGVSTSGSYTNPSWLVSIPSTKVTGLGTAATTSASAYDVAGAASAVQAASLQKSNNLSDLGTPATARTNLGLGTAATQPISAFEVPLTFTAPLSRSGNTISYAGPLVQATQATTDSSGNYTWTFPTAYSVAPKVLVSCQNSSTTVSYNVQATSVSATSATVHSFSLSVVLLILTLSTGAPCTVTIQATGN